MDRWIKERQRQIQRERGESPVPLAFDRPPDLLSAGDRRGALLHRYLHLHPRSRNRETSDAPAAERESNRAEARREGETAPVRCTRAEPGIVYLVGGQFVKRTRANCTNIAFQLHGTRYSSIRAKVSIVNQLARESTENETLGRIFTNYI